MKQFELWLANLNPGKGTMMGKVRPVVIVQTDLLNGDHSSTIVCPLTKAPIPCPVCMVVTPKSLT